MRSHSEYPLVRLNFLADSLQDPERHMAIRFDSIIRLSLERSESVIDYFADDSLLSAQ